MCFAEPRGRHAFTTQPLVAALSLLLIVSCWLHHAAGGFDPRLRSHLDGPFAVFHPGACSNIQQLMAKIKAKIAREWQKSNGKAVDWELLERMEQHQKAVAEAIAARANGGENKYLYM